LLRGRDLGDERLVLRLDAHDEQPHRRIAEIHAAMHDIRPHIICLSGVQHTRLLAGALKGEGALDDVGDLVGIGMNMPRRTALIGKV